MTCIVLHLLHVLLVFTTRTASSMWVAGSGAFLTAFRSFDRHLLLWVMQIPPLDLWQLKSFTVISCSLAYWSRAWYVTSSRLFLRSHPLLHFDSVWWHEIEVQFYIPVSHLLSTGIFQLGSWFADQVGWLTHCLLVLYRCISHWLWFQFDMSRLQGCPLWPWNSLWILLGFLICWDG